MSQTAEMTMFEELRDLEERARKAAIKDIEQKYSKAEDLEKLDHDIKRNIKRKEEYDSRLKTAVESQLEGIKTGVNLLKNAESEVKTVDDSLRDLSTELEQTVALRAKVQSVKEEYQRHTRLTTAINNMSYVFNASSSIEEIYKLLRSDDDQKNLLHIHKLLHDLEKSRDGLMFELYTSSGGRGNDGDVELLRKFFSDVPQITKALWEKIACTFRRVLDTALQNPRLLVTAVRIVDRQEQVDALCEERRSQTGFMPDDRPRRWRQKMLSTMEAVVQAKLEASQPQSQAESEHWLEQHFLLVRAFVCSDLRVARKLCTACFPPDYNIFDFYLSTYHRQLSERIGQLSEQALNNELHYRDCVALVKWTETFKNCFERLGVDVFNDPKFDMISEYSRLNLSPHFLAEPQFDQLIGHCTDLIAEQVWRWFQNAVEKEKLAWCASSTDFQPEHDLQTNTTYTSLVTSVAAILKDMVSEVGKQLPDKARAQLDALILDKLVDLIRSYSSAIADYVRSVRAEQDAQLREKKVVAMERIIVASLNNLHRLVLVTSQFLKQGAGAGGQDENRALDSRKLSLEQVCFEVSKEWIKYLTGEMIEYLQNLAFKPLFSPNWLLELRNNFGQQTEAGIIVHTVKEATDNAYKDLFTSLKSMLLTAMSERVCVEYLRSLMQQKPMLKETRGLVVERLRKDADELKDGFSKLTCRCDHFEAIVGVSELFKMGDLSLAELEINALLRNFPDLRQDQLELLLVMRGDCSKAEAKNIVAPSFSEEERSRRAGHPKKLFSLVTFK